MQSRKTMDDTKNRSTSIPEKVDEPTESVRLEPVGRDGLPIPPLKEVQKCKTCERPLWNGGHAINKSECHNPGGDVCLLTRDKNRLVLAARKLAENKCDQATTRTMLAIIEQISPSENICPVKDCRTPGVLDVRNNIKVHFKDVKDAKPCPASYNSVLGGVLIMVQK